MTLPAEPPHLARSLKAGTVVDLETAAFRLGKSLRQVRRYVAAGLLPVERYRRPDGRQRVVVRVLALLAAPLGTDRGKWQKTAQKRSGRTG